MSAAALRQNGVALAGFALTVAIFGVACWAYLGLGAYLDHIEGSVVVSGWEYISNGMPLYQLQDGVPRFATYYGPLSYLVEALVPAAVKASASPTAAHSDPAPAGNKTFLPRSRLDEARSNSQMQIVVNAPAVGEHPRRGAAADPETSKGGCCRT